jgi:hypothetical protein
LPFPWNVCRYWACAKSWARAGSGGLNLTQNGWRHETVKLLNGKSLCKHQYEHISE